jgi:hypothetical protein
MKWCIVALMIVFVPHPGSAQPSVPEFEIISFHGEWQHSFLWVIGEIKNTGRLAAGPQLEVIARDKKGILVDSARFWPNSNRNIPPGESRGIKYLVTQNKQTRRMEIKIIDTKVWSVR